MTVDFRALCADLLRELDHPSAWDYQQALKDQARAALARWGTPNLAEIRSSLGDAPTPPAPAAGEGQA